MRLQYERNALASETGQHSSDLPFAFPIIEHA
jgi:hypothetical protein